MPLSLLNERALDLMFTPAGGLSAGSVEGHAPPQLEGDAAARAIAKRLRKRIWKFHEYALPVGTAVTVEGIYRSHPPGIEIGHWVRHWRAKEAIHAGLAGESAKAHFRRQWTAAVLGLLVTGFLHSAVCADGGSL